MPISRPWLFVGGAVVATLVSFAGAAVLGPADAVTQVGFGAVALAVLLVVWYAVVYELRAFERAVA